MKTVISLMFFVLISSCAVSTEGSYVYNDPSFQKFERPTEKETQKEIDSIKIFMKQTPQKPFKEIAIIEAMVTQSIGPLPKLKDVIEELKKQAYKSGAEAVYNVKVTLGYTGGKESKRYISATATSIYFTSH